MSMRVKPINSSVKGTMSGIDSRNFLILLGLPAGGVWGSRQLAAVGERPNVLMILVDDLRPDATQVWDLKTCFRQAHPDCVTLSEDFKNNGYHAGALGKIYHREFEAGRPWSEPHRYPRGLVDKPDPQDWRNRSMDRFAPGDSDYVPDTLPALAWCLGLR